jgi:uncharacterized protein (DUF1330 family)
MPAYVIVDIEVTDPVSYGGYKKLAAPTVEAYGGKYIVRGGATQTLEGSWVPGRLVVLEFPTGDQAREWWGSDMYQPAKELRHKAANTEMILVEGHPD